MKHREMVAGTLAAALAACQPATTRPPYPAVPQATTVEVRLPPRDATRLLAEALQADSIPATRIILRDAWFETGWFDPATGARTAHRPIGQRVVLLRGWADPTQPGSSKVTVETVYRPMADPSLPQRELDRQVPRNHPVAIKVRAALQDLVKRYGGPPPPPSERRAAGPEEQQGPPVQDEGSPPEEAPPDQGAPPVESP
jgi:hypothetical protein